MPSNSGLTPRFSGFQPNIPAIGTPLHFGHGPNAGFLQNLFGQPQQQQPRFAASAIGSPFQRGMSGGFGYPANPGWAGLFGASQQPYQSTGGFSTVGGPQPFMNASSLLGGAGGNRNIYTEYEPRGADRAIARNWDMRFGNQPGPAAGTSAPGTDPGYLRASNFGGLNANQAPVGNPFLYF